MNRTQKFALNSMTTAISQVVAMIVGIITPRLMISTYGSEVNGLVSSLHQFISYITLVEAGIGGAAIFSLYKPLANKDELGVSRVVSSARKSYMQAGYIFSSGIFVLAFLYAFLRNTDELPFGMIFALTIFFGVNGCLDFFLVSGYRVLLTADQKTYILSTVGIIQTLVRTIIICVLAYLKSNVVLLYAIAALPVIFKALFLFVYCKKNYAYVDVKAKPDDSALKKRWDVIYQQVLGTVQTGAPTVIATVMLDLKLVSVYSIYNMVLNGINGILSIFISGLPAGFGELIAKDEKENLKKTASQFEVAYYYILSVVYGVTFVMILPFVSVYTNGITDVNYYYPALAFTIVLNGLLYNIKTPQSMLVISAGMYKETRWRVTAQGVIIIVFGVVFAIPYGLVGIMLGSCLSNLYRTIDLIYFTPKYITQQSARYTIFRILRVVMNIVLILLPTLFIKFNIVGYISWILYAFAFTIYAVVVVTVTTYIFDKKDFASLLTRMKKLLLKRG